MISQSHNPSPALLAETVPNEAPSPPSPRVGDGEGAPDLGLYRPVPAVPAPSPPVAPSSPSPPLYSGDRGRDASGRPSPATCWLWPFPDTFWTHPSTQAMAPEVWYAGPIPSGIRETLTDTPGGGAFVYVICDSLLLNVLYVGKTIDPVGRLKTHKATKEWWPAVGRLVLLHLSGEDRFEAEAAALYIETQAIRKLHPLHNIAGVDR